ncbi:MAG: transglycosylase SLT domain-containing protein, partial [Desulfobacterales bacterium]|nr:transglycosylase SLT domain-containing protein [Desulfobacterales bacterium]
MIVFIVLLSIGGVWAQSSGGITSAVLPALIESVRVNGPLDFCGEPVPLERQGVRERLEKELLLTLWDRPQVILWLKRWPRYMPHIEKMLAAAQLPADLRYLVIIESAMRAHAGSPKGAVGFWQFTRDTGRTYGLQVDGRKDERRNLFHSTRAAIEYLKVLHEDLGSWALAAAAYNMGEEGLKAEILAQETGDYYSLYLYLETQRYLFRAIAAKMIITNPAKYGFKVTDADLYPLLEFDPVEVDFNQDVGIQVLARAAETDFKTIKDLNPEIRGHYLAPGRHRVFIPKGRIEIFNRQFPELLKQWLVRHSSMVYIVKKGDNLTSISERYNVPLPALFIWNRLKINQHIHPGDRLVIYPN